MPQSGVLGVKTSSVGAGLGAAEIVWKRARRRRRGVLESILIDGGGWGFVMQLLDGGVGWDDLVEHC